VATKHIKKAHAITIDYRKSETEIAEPFECKCESENCGGFIGEPKLDLYDEKLVAKLAYDIETEFLEGVSWGDAIALVLVLARKYKQRRPELFDKIQDELIKS